MFEQNFKWVKKVKYNKQFFENEISSNYIVGTKEVAWRNKFGNFYGTQRATFYVCSKCVDVDAIYGFLPILLRFGCLWSAQFSIRYWFSISWRDFNRNVEIFSMVTL